METLTLKIPAELRRVVSDTADKLGESRSQFIREAIQYYVKHHPKKDSSKRKKKSFLEMADKYIGQGTGPADLSTNHQLLDDFGK